MMTRTKAEWDIFFLELAEYVSTASKDPSTKCGAVIVRPNNTVASTGHNAFAQGCNQDSEIYNDRPKKYERIIHGEMNAILSTREPLDGYTLYSWPPGETASCNRCTAHIIQSGIKRVVFYFLEGENRHHRWSNHHDEWRLMYEEAGVEVVGIPYEKD